MKRHDAHLPQSYTAKYSDMSIHNNMASVYIFDSESEINLFAESFSFFLLYLLGFDSFEFCL